MTIADFLSRAKKKLSGVSDSASLDAEILLSSLLEKPREFLFSRPEYLLSSAQKQKAGIALQRRMLGEPIAYIVEKKEFFGLDFFVDENTLVPRPETEILVEKACAFLQNGGTLLDIGTGSGCIPISIAKNSAVEKIFAIDICEKALAMAKKNAEKYGVEINFFQSDLLKNIPQSIFLEEKIPLVVTANLPYVPENEKHESVKKEPQTAIYSGEDGLNHYRELFEQLQEKSFDALLIEFHPPQAEKLQEMCKKVFPDFEFEVIKDLAGKERIGLLSKKNSLRDKK